MSTNATHNSPPEAGYVSPPITITLTALLLVFFFVGFFSIYFCRCFMQNIATSWHLRRSPSDTPIGRPSSNHGLDRSIMESFPKFLYSSVKDFRRGKDALECAICLSEFVDEDLLRLLTTCCHVFHQDCIDLWLESHKTCPVCRRSLDDPEKIPQKCPILCNSVQQDIDASNEGGSVSIDIRDDEEGKAGVSSQSAPPHTAADAEENDKTERFSRSHSTGHSIVVIKEDVNEDKYTLNLPEHVQSRITKGHNWTRSCTTFGDYSGNNAAGDNGGSGEVSGFSGGDINKV